MFTSFWIRKSWMKPENDFFNEMVQFDFRITGQHHHPIVGETLLGGWFPQGSFMGDVKVQLDPLELH